MLLRSPSDPAPVTPEEARGAMRATAAILLAAALFILLRFDVIAYAVHPNLGRLAIFAVFGIAFLLYRRVAYVFTAFFPQNLVIPAWLALAGYVGIKIVAPADPALDAVSRLLAGGVLMAGSFAAFRAAADPEKVLALRAEAAAEQNGAGR